MNKEYLCKVCRSHLKIKTSIVLAAAKVNDRSQRGLIFLNPEIGNYSTITHSSFKINEGEECIYTCPICSAQLNSMKYLHLVRILMVDEKEKEYSVYFSGITGENCTYKMSDNIIEEETGPDVKKYIKYFEVPEEDRKYL